MSNLATTADWTRVSDLYRQCREVLGDDGQAGYLPGGLSGILAETLSRVSASYWGQEEQMIADAQVALSEVADGLSFASLYRDPVFLADSAYQVVSGGPRRRPTPFEATVETARRLRDLNSVERALSDVPVGCILGGSASYGRFYNVKGAVNGDESSDLDFVLVLPDYDKLEQLGASLSGVQGVDPSSVDKFRSRVTAFSSEQQLAWGNTVFSGKLKMWTIDPDPVLANDSIGPQYSISLHVMSDELFNRLTFNDLKSVPTQDVKQEVFDFREAAATRQDHQRNFNGIDLRLSIETTQVGDSFLRSTHHFAIDKAGRYYPGMFQNLLLPQFDVRWGSTSLRRRLEAFRWKMVDRLREERRQRPNDYMRLSLSHTRSSVFAPHVVRAVDGSTVLS